MDFLAELKVLNWSLSENATRVIVFDSLSLLNLHLGPVGTNLTVGMRVSSRALVSVLLEDTRKE